MSSEEDFAQSEIDVELLGTAKLDTELEIKLLISLVENKPILWVKTLDKFSDSNEKRKAWREVFGLMRQGFEDLQHKEQKLIGKNIRKKWKLIKDAYFRTVKENKPTSGDGMTKKRKRDFIYHNQMQFLTRTIIPRKTISPIPEQHSEENVELQPSCSEIHLSAQVQNNEELKIKPKKIPRKVENTFMEYPEEVTEQNKDQQINNSNPVEKDEHENFFDSMLSVVRQFNVDQTLAFRAEMINVVQKLKRGTMYPIVQFQPPRYEQIPNNYRKYLHGTAQSTSPANSQMSNSSSISTLPFASSSI